jgi:hypothetical protein
MKHPRKMKAAPPKFETKAGVEAKNFWMKLRREYTLQGRVYILLRLTHMLWEDTF